MTVYINNYAETDYEEDMCLTPLFELLGNIKVKERVDSWAEETKSHTIGISYSGKRAFTSADSLQVINAESADIDENEDINGTADTNENSILSQLEYGGEVTGFAVTFSTGGEENTGEIITYIINPKYTSAAVLAQQNRQEQIEKAKTAPVMPQEIKTGIKIIVLYLAVRTKKEKRLHHGQKTGKMEACTFF